MGRASDVSEALATLQARWGAAAPRRGGDLLLHPVEGALARAPMPLPEDPDESPGEAPGGAPTPLAPSPRQRPAEPEPELDGRVVPTGFAALDAVLGMGGLPRTATVALRGQASSGRTTLGLRVAAEAQAGGAIVAWLDLARTFDPVEAVTRGIKSEWLVVLTPRDLEEALAMAGSLLAARTVDLLVVDLPDGRDPAVAGKRVGDRLGRLAALARRAGTLLLVLEPVALGRALATAVAEASGLRLELRRTGWIRLGRDVVGQRSAVEIARNRYGPPGRRAELEIRYAEGGARDACVARDELLDGRPSGAPPGARAAPERRPEPELRPAPEPLPLPFTELNGPQRSTDTHAPVAPALAPPAPAPGEGEDGVGIARRHLRLVAARPDRPRRHALDGRDRGGRGSTRAGPRRTPGDPARDRPPARARGDLPRPRA
jgi:recombination protein RecA